MHPDSAFEDVTIQLESSTKQTQGQAQLHAVPHQVARRKGLIAWLSCWGVALVALPIPLVHFLAPPLLLLMGPLVGFIAYKVYAGAIDIVGGGGECPDCGVSIDLSGRDAHWPLDVTCGSCQARLLVRLRPVSPA